VEISANRVIIVQKVIAKASFPLWGRSTLKAVASAGSFGGDFSAPFP
jgi:hypothetical protein